MSTTRSRSSKSRSGRATACRTWSRSRFCAQPAAPVRESRTAELGVVSIASGQGHITLRAQAPVELRLYGLTLIQLPAEQTGAENRFRFSHYSQSADRYGFTVETATPGLVLVNDTYYPGWTAKVNGQAREILRADGIFRAIPVGAGQHRIEMRFFPRRFWWGAAVSLIFALGVGTILTVGSGRKSLKPGN